jgi:hypothetical protein
MTNPPAINDVPVRAACQGAIRPDGIGRNGRDFASSWRSKKSLKAMPAQYRQPDEITSITQMMGRSSR